MEPFIHLGNQYLSIYYVPDITYNNSKQRRRSQPSVNRTPARQFQRDWGTSGCFEWASQGKLL